MTIILRTASEFHWLKESSPQAQIRLEHGSYNFRQTNFKDFSRPNKEIKYFSRTKTEFKDFSR